METKDKQFTNKPVVTELAAYAVSDDTHSIVYVNTSVTNRPPVDFMVKGFHPSDKEADFFIPRNTEHEFRKIMNNAPVLPVNVNFHGMDGKMIGHYKHDRLDNNGGGTLTSNAINPSTMTELFSMCTPDIDDIKPLYYILSPLSFYSTIESPDILIKVLEEDMTSVPNTHYATEGGDTKPIHMFVDSKFLCVSPFKCTKLTGKEDVIEKYFDGIPITQFGVIWIDTMIKKGYTIHICDNSCISSAIQFVFGVKTPDQTIHLNEYLTFDSTAEVEFAACTDYNVSVTARSNGRISLQTSASSVKNSTIIAIVKGRVSNVMLLNENADVIVFGFDTLKTIPSDEIETIGKIRTELIDYYDYKSTIFSTLQVYNMLREVSDEASRDEKNAVLLANSESIVQFMFCDSKGQKSEKGLKRVRFEEKEEEKPIDRLYKMMMSFTNEIFTREVNRLGAMHANHNRMNMNRHYPQIPPVQPALGRQSSCGYQSNNAY